MKRTYEPRINTIPWHAIAYLTTKPDEWVTAHVLGAATECLPKLMRHTLGPAVRHGLIVCERRAGLYQFKLGAGVSQQPLEDDEDDADVLDLKPSLKGHGYGIGRVASVFEMGDLAGAGAPQEAVPVVEVEPVAEVKANPDVWEQCGAARFAVWSDGTIDIEHGSELLKLSRSESEILAKLIRGQVL